MHTLLLSFILVLAVTSVQCFHWPKLFDVLSSDEDERQSCPRVDCAGLGPCANHAECPSLKCCIDLEAATACCYTPGGPTKPPATTAPPTSTAGQTQTAEPTPTAASTPTAAPSPTTGPTTTVAPTPTDAPIPSSAQPTTLPPAPFCENLVAHSTCGTTTPSACPCKTTSECFEDEICCLGNIGLGCYLKDPPTTSTTTTTTTTAATTVNTGPPGKCPDNNSPCLPVDIPIYCSGPATTGACSTGEICCIKSREFPGCCVKYP